MGPGKVDVNGALKGSNETILHILARKADKSNSSYNVYIECLKYALSSPGVDVDARENTASMTPLFIATDESKSREAAIALIKAGNSWVSKVVANGSCENMFYPIFQLFDSQRRRF